MNSLVIFVHTAGDIVIWATFTTIALIAIVAYVRGGVSHLNASYPALWRWGIGFLLFCGFTRLGEAFEIWLGLWTYTITAGIKLVTAACATGFTIKFWKVKDELIVAFRIMNRIAKEKEG